MQTLRYTVWTGRGAIGMTFQITLYALSRAVQNVNFVGCESMAAFKLPPHFAKIAKLELLNRIFSILFGNFNLAILCESHLKESSNFFQI